MSIDALGYIFDHSPTLADIEDVLAQLHEGGAPKLFVNSYTKDLSMTTTKNHSTIHDAPSDAELLRAYKEIEDQLSRLELQLDRANWHLMTNESTELRQWVQEKA